jgi:hypothetical protein
MTLDTNRAIALDENTCSFRMTFVISRCARRRAEYWARSFVLSPAMASERITPTLRRGRLRRLRVTLVRRAATSPAIKCASYFSKRSAERATSAPRR